MFSTVVISLQMKVETSTYSMDDIMTFYVLISRFELTA